jgi:glycosyltransferase involved in cell wall biosynthesis
MAFKTAVVTPYYQESPALLRQCHDSVLAQRGEGMEVVHLMVADGHAQPAIDEWAVRHIKLPLAHADNGNTPRSVGSLLADAEGFDFIAYLDADNWYHPDHLSSLVALWRVAQTPALSSWRSFHRWDGSLLNVTEKAEDTLMHVDTSCLLLHREAFEVLDVWHRMPRQLSPMCDRVMLAALVHGRHRVTSSLRRTVAFRSQYKFHFEAAGERAPPGSKVGVLQPCMDYLKSLQGVSACTRQLHFWPLVYLNKRWVEAAVENRAVAP